MWKDRYKIGVERIDEQHRELFQRVEEFLKATNDPQRTWEDKIEKVKETMNFMGEYVHYHFDDEEKLQEELGYPNIEDHKKAHEKFKKGIEEYIEKLENENYSEELVQEFGGKIMTWLIMHVGDVDQKIGDYVTKEREDC
ncbi:bacteriohemerythrin [Isachenkonia alkalipeptolytica]|uniref:Bacteriohemerythrin n=1 Tax=Isachenkonia alkalipeptolytica TaxID=2565777 RepID=A0AA43XJD4_9CLOT|nr:hemerythrin family protein [Isachenkonia alkalipeptolytica]NBG87903.1 bacteriohemerythrin [Isachenkonia alkalipeptolytica]